jgi:hypothetical protein
MEYTARNHASTRQTAVDESDFKSLLDLDDDRNVSNDVMYLSINVLGRIIFASPANNLSKQ